MKHILPFSLIVIATLILAACASSRSDSSVNKSLTYASGAPAPAVAPGMQEAMPATDQIAVSNDSSNIPVPGVDRIVIQNADLSIVVSDVEGRMKNIQVMAEQMGGYVVSSNLYQGYTSDGVPVPEAQVAIRVPAEKLEDVLNQVKKDVVEVQTETRNGQDVTAAYVDLQSRLKNLEAAEAQLNEILKNTTNTEDVVSIFNQLVTYREQIEVIKGQIKYYDEAAALSAISVHIVAAETIRPIVIGKWEPKGVALQAVQDLINFLKGFINFLIRFVIYTLPVWIIIGIPLYLVFLGARALFRKIRGNKPKKEQPKEDDVAK
jgi:hypothetical protein